MNNFKRVNTILGWASFVIALVVYTLTLEPSVSLWDCGEFISASYRLQVVHPPGAPLFLMLGRIFSIFATPGTNEVAIAVNMLSAVASAAAVMFTYWITAHFAKKILKEDINATQIGLSNAIAIIGSGLVAALSVTFMDTFWFSAVEAEVYAGSSCFTALAFWAILRWERVKDEPTSDRWIVFIAYVIGLGIGLHLLNILVVPAVIFYYFVNKYGSTTSNVLKAAVVGLGSIALLQWIIIPKTPAVAAFFDKIFVNSFGLPYNSGVLFFLLLIGIGIYFGLKYTVKLNKPILNLVILCYAFIMLGFSSYAMVVIRSIAEPAVNMNAPKDAESLLSYINREQYGSRPLVKGPYWNARLTKVEQGGATYRRGDEGYEKTGTKQIPIYDDKYSTMFPRMGDMSDKSQYYPIWSGMDDMYKGIQMLEQQVRNNPQDQDLRQKLEEAKMRKPTMVNNMKFLWNYQIKWMYVRYFMWNFAGRQDDVQNVTGNGLNGNWISGIKPIDESRLGISQDLPNQLSNHKAHNTYYFLPLIFGILGMIVMSKRSKMDFYTVLIMFIFTGLLVVIYLNQPPLEPRERDYTFAGSFQTFCIWVGLGVLFIYDLIGKKLKMKNTGLAIGATVISLLAAPVLMGFQNWDDHDRSDRYLGISFAKNYLNSCEQNAILFTNGDNDTYPLWYAQNVEGVRTDVRVINYNLLPTEWYNSVLRNKVFDSEALPFTIPAEKMVEGKRDYVRFYDPKTFNQQQFYPLDQVLQYITSDDKRKMQMTNANEMINVFPVQNFSIDVDKDAVIKTGFVPAKDHDKIVDKMYWNIARTGLSKGDLIALDIIATNAKEGWKRPIYWTTTAGSSVFLNLDKYLRNNGLTYQLLPVEANTRMRGMDDMDMLYDKFMNVYEWGNMDKGEMFLDEKAQLVPQNLRNMFVQMATHYAGNNMLDSAVNLLDRCYEAIPESILPINLRLKAASADIYYKAGQTEKADKMLQEIGDDAFELVRYYSKSSGDDWKGVGSEKRENLTILRDIGPLANQHNRSELGKKYTDLYNQVNTAY